MDQELQKLAERFGSETVTFVRGKGDLIFVRVLNPFAEAEIALHGAHVVSYIPVNQPPVLWMSEKSDFSANGAIRGGIPICWPWFGAHPTDKLLPAHGFARRSNWHIDGIETMANGATRVTLALTGADVPEQYAATPFELKYIVTVGASLECALTMRNTGKEDFPVSAALHSYFTVGAAEEIAVSGLEGMEFVDTLNNTTHTEQSPVRIAAEVDRRYVDNGQAATIGDPVLDRRIRIEKSNSYSTVVWNPWVEKSQRMPDFGDEEYHRMVCVETCNCGTDSRVVKPGESYTFGCKIMAL